MRPVSAPAHDTGRSISADTPADLILAQDDLLRARADERATLHALVAALRADLATRDAELDRVRRQRDHAEQAWEDAFEEATKWEAEYGDRSAGQVEAKRRRIEAMGAALQSEMVRLRTEAERAGELEAERDALAAELDEVRATEVRWSNWSLTHGADFR
jgi:chromosome segregation ATPase